MPSISEVALTNTFDEWRTISNHLVSNVNAANSSDPTTSIVFANSTGGFAVNTVTTNTATGTLTTGTRLVFTGGNVNFSTSNVASLGNVHQVHILGGSTVTGDSPSSSIANVQLNNSEINLNGKNFSANGSSTIDLENATISNLGTITTADINGGTVDGAAITCTGATDLLTLSQSGGSNPHVFTGAQISGGTFTGATQNAGLSHSSNVSVNGAGFLATTNSTCLGLDAGASTNVAIGKFPEIDVARSGDTNHVPTSSKSRVHIRTDFAAGSAAATAVVASADELTIEGNTAVGMTLLSNTASNAHIAFGDSADADAGGIIYNHNTNQMHFVGAGANTVMFDDTAGGCIQIPGGGTLGTTAGKLHINVGSTDAKTGLFIDSNDADRIALEIDGEQTTMNAVSFDVDALTSGHGLTVHTGIGTATTQAMTGSLFAVNDNNSSTNSRDIVGIVQEHADATGTTALSIRTDSGRGIFVDQNANNVAMLVDAENDEANSVQIVSDALSTGSALTVSSTATHSGNLVSLISDGAATGTTLYARSDATTNTTNMILVANSSSNIIEQEVGGELTHKGKFMMPVLNSRQGYGASSVNYLPIVAGYATGSTPTNGVLIKTSLPFTNSIDMPIIKIEGYEYGNSRTIDLTLAFYIYGSAFGSASLSSSGGKAPAIKLCTHTSGTKVAIHIGALAYFPRFRVSATSTFGPNNTNLESWYKGWTIADDTGPTGANQVDVTYNSVIGPGLSVSGSSTEINTASITDTLSVTGATTLSNTLSVTGATSLSNTFSVANNATISGTLGVTQATSLSSTLSVTGAATFSTSLTATSGTQTFGNDVRVGEYLYHSGDTDTYIRFGSGASGNIFEFYTGGSKQMAMNTNFTGLYYGGSLKFETTNYGVKTTGDLDVTYGSLTATSGTTTFGSDVRVGEYIYHDNDTNTYIKYGTDVIDFYTGGDRQLYMDENSTHLYHNGTERLATDWGGVNVLGNLSVSSAITATSGTVTFGSDVRVGEYIYHDQDTNTYIKYGADVIDFYTGGDRQLGLDSSTTYLYYNGSNKFYTSSAGVTVSGTLTETSALALKENIEPITNSLSIINDLQGVKYDWKDKENFEDRRQIGLIAENVKEVIPEAESDGSVTYTKLVGLLIEGIKDLNKEVNELKAKING